MTRQEKAKAEFWKEAYLEAIGPAMAGNWKTDGKPQNTAEQRCAIARSGQPFSLACYCGDAP